MPTETPSLVPGYWENKFVSEVDLERGKIKVRVNTLIRQLAPDYSTENEEIKEYLTWNTSWFAQNYLGEKLAYHSHISGVYQEQLKELVRSRDPKTFEEIQEFRHGGTRQAFYVPFTKKKVDEVLGDHPFGPDSVNITNMDQVLFYGKFTYAKPPFRSHSFNYEEFTTWTFQQMLDKASKPQSPLTDELEKVVRKFSHIA